MSEYIGEEPNLEDELSVDEVLTKCTIFFKEHRADIFAEMSDIDFDDFIIGLPELFPDSDLLHLYSNLFTQLELFGLNAEDILAKIGVFEEKGNG